MFEKFYFIFILLLITTSCKKNNIPSQNNENLIQSKYTSDKEININVDDTITISGSLVYGGSDVLSIIIAGSGPTDRNCNSIVGVNTNAFLMLSDSLKRAGISSYRYDKRGVGKSTKVESSKVDFNDFVNDARSIVNYFKDDFDHINIIGHSEGALIGTLVSQDNPDVRSFVNLCGTSISLDSIALEQLERYPKLLDEAKLHFEEIRAGDSLSQVNPMLASLFNPSVVKFFTSIMAYNPSQEHAKVKIPVLVLGGSCDIQVPEKHAKKLFATLPHENNDNKYLMIDGMGHVLKQNNSECSDNQESYTDGSKPLHSLLSRSISEFINAISE